MNNHVFIACSPLQLRIVSVIKKQLGEENNKFYIIYLKATSKLNSEILLSTSQDYDNKLITDMNYGILNFRKIMKFFSNIKIDKLFVYIANANDLIIQYILSNINVSYVLRTFDDGILNINSLKDINFEFKENKRIKYRLTKLIYGNVYSVKKIIETTECHYTILEQNKNINVKSNVIKLSLFNSQLKNCCQDEINISSNSDVLNIFIGSRFKDILRDKNNLNSLIKTINKLKNRFETMIYLRHPRETMENCFFMEERKISFISEDFIIELINNGHCVNLIGFASTCQLNLMNFPNVTITLLKTELIREDILESFSIFGSCSKLVIVDID